MQIRQRRGDGALGRRGWVCTFAMVPLLTLGFVLPTPQNAAALPSNQDSGTICRVPETISIEDASQPGTPEIASPVASPVASPAASSVASPVAGEDVGTARQNGVTGQIERSLSAIAVCQSDRRVKSLTRFVTENFLSDVYAGGGKITKEQFIVLGRDLPKVPVEILSVSRVEVDSYGIATADVVWTVSRQLFHAEWSFVFERQEPGDDTGDDDPSGYWLADGVKPLTVTAPDGAKEVDIEINTASFDPQRIGVRGSDFVLFAENKGKVDHELLVLKLDEGVTTAVLLREPGAALPDGVTVIGQLTIPAGEEGRLVLVGVEKGTYAVVDLLPDENGTPHLALGMEATLRVR